MKNKELIKESKKCNNCLDWHKYCNAECCNTVYINLNPEALKRPGKILVVRKTLNRDMQRYFMLRGVKYAHGLLRFKKEYCFAEGNRIIYDRTCSLLENMKCLGHPNKKPLFCQELTKETSCDKRFGITPNCLFKYQLMEEE